MLACQRHYTGRRARNGQAIRAGVCDNVLQNDGGGTERALNTLDTDRLTRLSLQNADFGSYPPGLFSHEDLIANATYLVGRTGGHQLQPKLRNSSLGSLRFGGRDGTVHQQVSGNASAHLFDNRVGPCRVAESLRDQREML